jgi:hypothetical protein
VATGPAALGRRYTPLLVLAMVQVLLVALAPSNGGTTVATSGLGSNIGTGSNGLVGSSGGGGSGGGSALGGSGSSGGVGGTGGAGGAGGGGTTGGSSAGSGSSGGGATGSGGGTGSVGGAGGTGGASGVTFSGGGATVRDAGCVNGRQAGPTYYMPPCNPSYTPDPQARMTGVTGTQIKFVYWVAQGNPEVNAILNSEGLAESPQQACANAQAFTGELNKRYEFYGRQVVSMDGPGANSGRAAGHCNFGFFQSACNLTPPDIPCLQSEADEIAHMRPSMVLAPAAFPEFYIRLAQDHVFTVGGSAGGENVPESYYQQLAPYWYDIFPNGTQTAAQLSEFYCKKLVNHPVQYAGKGAGDVIPIAGGAPTRKLGIIYPENGDTIEKAVADELASDVAACGAKSTQEYSYQSNITTAQEQSTTTVAAIKQAHVTTVVCICDPIAPVFLTTTLDQQQYHPEWLIPGSGLLDYDVLAQLYNANEMRYAFGPSELADPIPFAQTDAVKAWQDAGYSGQPDKASNLPWAYFSFLGTLFQDAGPSPSVANIVQGLQSEAPEGGTPTETLIAYRPPNPYTGIKDFREVWYCPTTASPINGQPGAYEAAYSGHRFQLGQLNGGTGELFPNGECA